MSALAGLRIDNCEVWVDRAEIPAFDGSSLPVVEALQEAGVRPQGVPRPKLVVQRELVVQHDGSWIRALPGESPGCLDLRYELDYPETAIGQQNLELRISPESFVRELAPARTFLLESEAQWLRSRGLGRQVSFQDLLVFGEDGVIENRLRFEDECVRHKALDVIGDLAIAGFDIEGRIVAHKSGHQLNGQFVRRLIQEAAIAAATDGATGGQPTDTLRESA